MSRRSLLGNISEASFPRSRGDEPMHSLRYGRLDQFSPLTRG